jgi:sarcosine oxidase subunit gamma
MHELAALTPLGASAPRVETVGSMKIGEITDIALASVEARASDGNALSKAAKSLLKDDLPEVGKSSGKGEIRAFWIGPGKWLFSAPIASHEDLAARLEAEFGKGASVTEQTNGFACFSVESRDLSEYLLRLVQVDMHDALAGAVYRIAIEHVGCIVVCDEPGRSIRFLCSRSYAGHLHHALLTAARSVGG